MYLETEVQRGKVLAQRDRGAQWGSTQLPGPEVLRLHKAPGSAHKGTELSPQPALLLLFPKAGLQTARL